MRRVFFFTYVNERKILSEGREGFLCEGREEFLCEGSEGSSSLQ